MSRGDINTIQQTSKKWKLLQVLSWLFFVPGLAWLAWVFFGVIDMGMERAAGKTVIDLVIDPRLWGAYALLLVGFLLDVTGRFFAWWHHG